MAKIKPKKAYARVISDGFAGIGEASAGKLRTADIRNFRILSDGSLQKRCGWRTTHTLPDAVRAYWDGTLEGQAYRFVVSGNRVFRLDSTGRLQVGTVSNTGGSIRFFSYHGFLYLLDGEKIRVYNVTNASFREACGYAPLYGYNWHPSGMGEENEPINLLSNRLRVHYFNVTAGTDFRLPFYVKSVDSVRVDGEHIDDFYTLSDGRTLRVPAASTKGSVEVAFTISMEGTMFEQLNQCAYAFRDCGEGHENLILYGSPNGNMLFCGAKVSTSMHYGSLAEYSDSDPLYFTHNMLLTLGSAEHPIRSLYLNHGRILALHEAGGFSLSLATEGDLVEAYALPSCMGCTLPGTELYLEGDPIVIHREGIFRMESPSGNPDAFEMIPLASGIAELRTESFVETGVVCEDLAHGEMWFCDPDDEDGRVWIYQTATKQWVTFDNIAPRLFFRNAGELGFARQNKLCVFDNALYTDDGAPFAATYQSGFVDFSSPEEQKRALRLTLCADSKGNPIEVTVQSEHTYRMKALHGSRQILPEFFDLRFALGRFRFLEVALSDTGTARSRLYRLALFANP